MLRRTSLFPSSFAGERWPAAKIEGYPLSGIGLGGTYCPPTPSDVIPEQVRYVQSGCLYLPLKMGLIALPILLGWIEKWSRKVERCDKWKLWV